MYDFEVIYLINKGLILANVHEEGGIFLKFSTLPIHYVTHYCARRECQLFKSSPEVIQEERFAQYGKIILKSLKNFFIWFNQVAVFTIISWNHYTEIFINFGTKRLYRFPGNAARIRHLSKPPSWTDNKVNKSQHSGRFKNGWVSQ